MSDLRTWDVEVEGQKFKIILCSRVGLARAWGFFQKGEEERTRNRRERGEGGRERGRKRAGETAAPSQSLRRLNKPLSFSSRVRSQSLALRVRDRASH